MDGAAALVLVGLAGLIVLGVSAELFERAEDRRRDAERERDHHRRLLRELRDLEDTPSPPGPRSVDDTPGPGGNSPSQATGGKRER